MNDFKIVVIENTYDLIQKSKEVREFLPKIFKIKLDGYRPYYDYGIMPMCDTDFWGNHVALCLVKDGELEPVMAFKSVTTNDALRMNKEFPLYPHVLNGKDCSKHLMACREWVKSKTLKGENVGYNHSWTLCPEYKRDKEVKVTALELTRVLMYRYYYEYNIPNMILACSRKYKVNKLMEFVGFDYLKDGNEIMPDFKPEGFNGEDFCMMHIENMNHSPEVRELYLKYKSLWENRIVYSPNEERSIAA